jgi:hypothetical protein
MDEVFRNTKLGQIGRIASEILAGHPDPISLMKTWPFPKGPFLSEEENLRHVLDHFAADEDIRAKSDEYARRQIEEVRHQLDKFMKSNTTSSAES